MKLIIFDFDGVLVNTLELSYKIHVTKNKDFTWEHFQNFSMGNFWEGYDKALKDGKHVDPDDFHGDYKKGLDVLNIEDILHDSVLSLATNYRLAIVSSTSSLHINDFLTKENLDGCFSDILGSDVHKNKTLKIKTILEKYKLSPNDAVFITDTLGDIKEANECDIKSIAVTWGLHEKDTLERGNPIKIIDDPRDLIDAIESVLN